MAGRRPALRAPELGLWLCAALTLGWGCDRGPSSSSSAGTAVTVAPSPPAPSPAGLRPSQAPASSAAPIADAAEAESLQLLELRATSAIRDKEPADTLHSATPGKRLYVHLRLRNRTGFTRLCELTFRVNGVVRTTVSLEVEPSWNFRTWAYATLLPGDREGALEVHVEDDTGAVLAQRSYPIATGRR